MADYDVIIVGTGAGGGTLARHLAPSGKRILLLERGDWLPREPQNWLAQDVFVDNRYVSEDTWYDEKGKPFQPQIHYFVGGATKLYGAALYRLRAEDFGELQHHDGVSPAWPITYDELEPYYTKAEHYYEVHGNHGEDPTEGFASAQYPFPAVSHEPRIQQLSDDLEAAGLHPFHAPCGIRLNESNMPYSACVRCANCDGFVCAVHGRRGRPRLRRREHGEAALPLGDGQASEWPRQRLRPGGAQLHVPQQPGRALALTRGEPDHLPEDARAQRLLLRRQRPRLSARQHPDGRQVTGAHVPRRAARRDEARAAVDAREGREARDRLLALHRGSPVAREPCHRRQGRQVDARLPLDERHAQE